MLAIFLDQEATGLDATKHAVLEVAFKILDISTNQFVMTYQSIVKHPKEVWDKRDPVSVGVNGFEFEHLANGKEPLQIKQEIITAFTEVGVQRGKAVFICQNPAFDRGFFAQLIDVYTQERLHWPYHWRDLASMYWTVQMQNCRQKGEPFPREMNLSKDEIAKYYNLPKENHPHKAMNGVDHLILCYRAVFS